VKKTWIPTLVFLLLLTGSSPFALGCNYAGKMRTYARALARWNALPNMNNSDRLCRAIRRIDCKFKNKPGKPTPPTPAGLACPPKGNGGGRGGGPLSVIVGIGAGPILTHGWVRNHNAADCQFTFTITPDPGNPPGFTASPLIGMIDVPGGGSASVDFDVEVAPGTPNGAVAFFDIEWIDGCTNLPLADEFETFQVTADSEISVTPVMPLFPASPGLPTSVAWNVANHTPAPVTRAFSFFWQGDPASVVERNDGTPYDIKNLFPADKTTFGGGSVTVPANDAEIIVKDDLLPGEFCDPEMIGCCGIDFGGVPCCALIPNDDLGPPFRIVPPFYDLVGTPSGVGQIGFDINGFIVQVPTIAAPTVPELLDLLVVQTLNLSENQNGFNYMPIVDDTGFMLLFPMDVLFDFQFFSTDPLLQWQPDLPLLTPPAGSWNGGAGQLELMVQSVNGWRVPE